MTSLIRKLADATRGAVLYGAWSQEEGAFTDPEAPCCIGAKLANFFRVASGSPKDFFRGADAFARALGGNRLHVVCLLQEAGAGDSPLSSLDWDNDREIVWNNLMKAETLPDLRNRTYTSIDLTDMQAPGLDVSGAIFEGCIFTDAVLTQAVFDDVRAPYSEFRRTDLRNASFRNAVLRNSHFNGADLSGADLTNASFRYACIEETDFTQADVAGADFHGVNFIGTTLKAARNTEHAQRD